MVNDFSGLFLSWFK
ncbi:hypothetical protein VCHC50A2_0292A, partial [Vibrio cholerae HC-50A2]